MSNGDGTGKWYQISSSAYARMLGLPDTFQFPEAVKLDEKTGEEIRKKNGDRWYTGGTVEWDFDEDHNLVQKRYARGNNITVVGNGMSPAVTHAVVKPLYDMLRSAENGGAEVSSAEVRYSIVDINGTNVAYIDNPMSNKQAESFEYVSGIFAKMLNNYAEVLKTSDRIYIGKDIQTEYIRSDYTTSILKNRNLLRAKFKAASGILDVIQVATNKRTDGPAKKENTSVEVSRVWKYKTNYAFPVRQSDGKLVDIKAYSATAVVLEDNSGKLYLYDIVTIKEKKGIANLLKQQANARSALETQDLSYSILPQLATDVKGESGTLIAQHNMSEDNLIRALLAGAFMAPSIAVTNDSATHQSYGDVSIVFNRSAVDPQMNKKNRLYSGDAYTPFNGRTSVRGVVDDTFKKLRMQLFGLSEEADNAGDDALAEFYAEGDLVLNGIAKAGTLESGINLIKTSKYKKGREALREVYKVNSDEELFEYLREMLGEHIDYLSNSPEASVENMFGSAYSQSLLNYYGRYAEDVYAADFDSIDEAHESEYRIGNEHDSTWNMSTDVIVPAIQNILLNYSDEKTARTVAYHAVKGFKTEIGKQNVESIYRAILKKIGTEYTSKMNNDELSQIRQSISAVVNSRTNYFEARPERTVSLSEVEFVVIPESAKRHTKDLLDVNGIKWYSYDGTAEDRAKVINEQSRNIRFSIPTSQDAAYMDAVNSGDMETAQRMVDEAAKAAGYDSAYIFWRGDSDEYNVLLNSAELNDEYPEPGNLGHGLYFTPVKAYADRFGGITRRFYLNADSIDVMQENVRQRISEITEDEPWLDNEDIAQAILDEFGGNALTGAGVGGFSAGASETMVRESWQAKLADPVTYDDNGKIIPLSRRLNSQSDDIRYSIVDITSDEGTEYGQGVLLDTNLFNGLKPRNWGTALRNYVYQNLAGQELVMYDDAGNAELVRIARQNDRVRKDGAKNSHRVIDKLARTTGNNIRTLAIAHSDELLSVSGDETTTDEHNHQWLDENGWILRKAYIMDRSGNIYSANLNIANGRNGLTLYDINKIERIGHGDVPSTIAGSGSHINPDSNGETVPQTSDPVNTENRRLCPLLSGRSLHGW